jgi:HEAT repeat protein
MLTTSARILRRIGEPEDAEALLPLLKHPEWIVRINAATALGKIGDAETAEKIKQVLRQYAESLSAKQLREELQSERKQDSFLHEGFQAVANIKYRALLKKLLKEKDRTDSG